MIVDGDVLPRQRLSHRSLARRLGLGRSPVRDALLKLESEGLIEHRPSSGIYLREITLQELDGIYEMRIVNETHAAGQAAERASAAQMEQLGTICDELSSIAGKPDLVAWFSELENRRTVCRIDMRFHMSVLEAAGNPVACKLLANSHLLAMKFSWDLGHGQPDWYADGIDRTARGHRTIYEAICNRDPQAARTAMLEHVTWARIEIPERAASLRKLDSFTPRRATAGRARRERVSGGDAAPTTKRARRHDDEAGGSIE